MKKSKLNKRNIIFIAVLSIALTAQSCALGSQRGSGPAGVWGSEDRGQTWIKLNEVAVREGRSTRSILDKTGIRDIVLSPENSLVLYAATPAGLYGSDNAGNTWHNLLPIDITDVAVAPNNSDVLYAAGIEDGQGVIYKSLNKGRDWERKYIDPSGSRAVTLAVNPADFFDVFVGFSSGLISNTTDGGENWHPVNTLTGTFKKMVFQTGDPRAFYILMEKQGLFLTRDRGRSFFPLSRSLFSRSANLNTALNEEGDIVFLDEKTPDIPNVFLDFEFRSDNPSVIYLVTDIGLFISTDSGASWREVRLPIIPRRAQSAAVGLSTDPNTFYVGIGEVIFRSVDGGRTFATTKIPTDRLIKVIKTVPGSPDIIYTGMTN